MRRRGKNDEVRNQKSAGVPNDEAANESVQVSVAMAKYQSRWMAEIFWLDMV